MKAKNMCILRDIFTIEVSTLVLLAATATAFPGDTFMGAKVGDTVNVRSELQLLNNATVTAITSSNITVLSGLDSFVLFLTNTVVSESETPVNIRAKVGDRVDVKSGPLIMLKHALLTGMTSSNVTVATSLETLTLPLSNTVIRLAQKSAPAASIYIAQTQGASPAPQAARPASHGAGNPVIQQTLGKYSSDPHYNDAVAMYQKTMAGIDTGAIQLDDVVKQAEQVLGNLDQFDSERAKDPQFEGCISILQNFVTRAHAGEQIAPQQY